MEGLLIYDHPLLSPLSLSLAASLGGHSWLSQSVYLSLAFSALFSSALVIPEPQNASSSLSSVEDYIQ